MGKHAKHRKHRDESKINKSRKEKSQKGVKKRKEKNEKCNQVVDCSDFDVPIDLMNTKANFPETPEEHAHKQKIIRRVVDPSTGRLRLVKGDGEILEEIVSRQQHNEINKLATEHDGNFFQQKTVGFNK